MINRTVAMAAICAGIPFAGILCAAPASAQVGQSYDCPTLISAAEARRGIPRGLLMAIAVTESSVNGRPDPYAMNIAGRGYHAAGFKEMSDVIGANWARGVTSIDVGCMQINLKYHGNRFQRLTDLLDPTTNVEYGAGFLTTLATQGGSWKEAVMSYHNKTNPARRQWYGCKVWNNYLRISAARTGYLNCGTPNGSSTASITTSARVMSISTVNRLAGPSASDAPGPLRPPTDLGGYSGQTVIGDESVDVPTPRRRVRGSITIVGAEGSIPDVVADDPRAHAFNSIRPVDWSSRTRGGAPAPEMEEAVAATSEPDQSGFGRVTPR